MSWTDDRVDLLKKLWGEGHTAAEIAKELGGVTRNAVIGKAHRLKLSGRASPIQQAPKKKASNTNTKQSKPKVAASNTNVSTPAAKTNVEPPAIVDVISDADKNRKRIPLTELQPGQCRWPIGDPRDKDFGFCGCKAAPGMAYCEEHAKIAYQTSSKARILRAEDLEREEAARAERMALNS